MYIHLLCFIYINILNMPLFFLYITNGETAASCTLPRIQGTAKQRQQSTSIESRELFPEASLSPTPLG